MCGHGHGRGAAGAISGSSIHRMAHRPIMWWFMIVAHNDAPGVSLLGYSNL